MENALMFSVGLAGSMITAPLVVIVPILCIILLASHRIFAIWKAGCFLSEEQK
jgi:hypothetical protein